MVVLKKKLKMRNLRILFVLMILCFYQNVGSIIHVILKLMILCVNLSLYLEKSINKGVVCM